MGAAQITTKTLLIALFAIAATETAAAGIAITMDAFPLEQLGLLRLVQTAAMLLILLNQTEGVTIIGLERSRLHAGIATGILCSLVFAFTAAMGFGVLYLLDYNPLDFVRVPLPSTLRDLGIFFLVGGGIAPIAEEVFFRGILFGYLSQWNVATAVILSSSIFVFFHPQGGIIQAMGGVVFALAYHLSRSLAAPIIIHSLGNLALFTLSLLAR